MSDKVDVIVVGGGVIGLSCAWRLAQDGRDVLLLEKSYCGSGASGASLGALMPTSATKHGPTQRWQRDCLWAYPAFAEELQDASGVDVGYRRCELLELMTGEQRRRHALSEVRIAGAEWPAVGDGPTMAVLSADEAARIEPHIVYPPLGVRYCRATAEVDVESLLAALRTACVGRGVRIEEGVAVTGLLRDGACVAGVTHDGRPRAAGAVLVAAGAWSSGLDPVLERAAAIRPVRGQALLLRTSRPLVERMIKRGRNYLMPRPNNEVLVGSTTEPEAGFDVRPTADGVAALAAGAMELMPALADAAFVRVWAGLRPEPLASRPLMGPIAGVPGLFVAVGHYKTGIGMCSLTGRILADLIAGREAAVDVAPFAPGDG